MPPAKNAKQVFDKILSRFEARGGAYYGENVTEQQHALQCADLAQRAGEPSALIVACLLHDYGHLLHEQGEDIADRGVDAQHERLGAATLAKHFPPEVVDPIELHVAAKRYLCALDAQYLATLSEASKLSLKLQGGPMSEDEVIQFRSHPNFEAAVKLRHYDDAAKVQNATTRPLEDYRELVEALVTHP